MKLDSTGRITWYVNSRAMIEPLLRSRQVNSVPSREQEFGFRRAPLRPRDDEEGFVNGFAPLPGSEDVTGTASAAVIVVATDFSPASFHAAQVAASIARHTQAKLVFCHAIAPKVLGFEPSTLHWVLESLRTEATQKMRAVRRLAEEASVATECVLQEGPPAKVILQTARRAGADLLVLTQREHSPWARLLFGPTTTEQVLRATECHAVVVRASAA